MLGNFLAQQGIQFSESLEETPYNRYVRFAGPSGERFLVNADGTVETIGVEPEFAQAMVSAGIDLRRETEPPPAAGLDSTTNATDAGTPPGARTPSPPPPSPNDRPTEAKEKEPDHLQATLEVLRQFLKDRDVEFREAPASYRGGQRVDGPSGERFLVTTTGAIVLRGEASALSKSVKSAGLIASGKSVRILVETGRWTPGTRHIPLGLGILIRLGVLWAFTLPFVSASCGDQETKPVSGYELVLGAEPEWLTRPPSSASAEDREEARQAIQSHVGPARAVFTLTIAALIAGVVFFVLPRASQGAWLLLLLTGASLVGLVGVIPPPPALVVGAVVHHHAGVGVLSALMATGAVTDVWSVKASLHDAGTGDPLTAWRLGCGFLLLLPLVLLLAYGMLEVFAGPDGG